MNFIYVLIDPRNDQIRYVGKTDNPERRLAAHLIEKYKSHKTNWIQGLVANDLKPIITIIEEVPEGQSWEDRERYWITYYRSLDCKLTNMTDGGEQGPDCTGKNLVKSEATRQKIIAALIKRNKSPEGREASRRSGQKNKGRKRPQEAIEKQRKWMTGRKVHTEETKQALIERNKARKYDNKARETMRENSRRLWDDPIKGPELRARLAERNKSDEFKKLVSKRAKERSNPEDMSKRARRLWDDPIKGPALRAKLAERNKNRHKKSQDQNV